MRSSIKDIGILKSKEENANIVKEKIRSNSKVSFFLEDGLDKKVEEKKSKSRLSLLKKDSKENKEGLDKKIEKENKITEEM